MTYKGRLTGLVFVFINVLGTVIFNDQIAPLYYIIILTYMIIGWWFGLQFDKLKFVSERDPLTNLYNRRFIYAIFPKLAHQADRSKSVLIVMVVDVDRFKEINDRYGHKIGDVVLEIISGVLIEHTGEQDVIARWGGDEFLVIASLDEDDMTSEEFNMRINGKLQEVPHMTQNLIQVSIGMSIYPTDARTLDHLVQMADHRMYEQKYDGRR